MRGSQTAILDLPVYVKVADKKDDAGNRTKETIVPPPPVGGSLSFSPRLRLGDLVSPLVKDGELDPTGTFDALGPERFTGSRAVACCRFVSA